MAMITPKELAREVGINFKYCRLLIRQRFERPPGTRWRWDKQQAQEVRRYLRTKLKGKKR